jgi:hypothetical protein
MKPKLPILSAILLISIAMSACNLLSVGANRATETPTPNLLFTSVALTAIAEATGVVTLSPTATTTPTDTPTLTPTFTQTPTFTPTSTKTRIPLPCYRASFVSDVTIPDGSNFNPGDHFTKIWRLLNGGTCSWTTNFKLIFDHGNAMSGPASENLPTNVFPGQTVDIAVNLIAPSTPGSYTGFWKLQTDQGALFGIDPNAISDFWVIINVAGSTNTPTPTPTSFTVTHVTMSVDTADITVPCGPGGHKFVFTANIQTDGAGQVKFHWERSDGSKSNKKTLNFSGPGTKTVTDNWTLGDSGVVSPNPFTGWERIFVDSPNGAPFSKQNFKITCS